MVRGESTEAEDTGGRRVVYCVIPAELADRLHEPLRRHFRDEPHVEVIVERRASERRSGVDRRQAPGDPPGDRERRRVRRPAGRRAGERRSAASPLHSAPRLPRRAQRHIDRIRFVTRVEPPTQQAEEHDAARLIARFQGGDVNSFTGLYERYFDRVYAYLRVALRDQHEAEDGTQQVFTQLFEALPRYEPRGSFSAWLFTIVRNQAIDLLRRNGRLEAVDPEQIDRRRDHPAADETLPVLNWLTDRDLMLFFERLPLAQRQVLVLRFMLDLSHRDIASILERSEVDVRRLQHRGLRFLERRLAAVGRVPQRPESRRMLRHQKQAQVLRRRRCALIG